METGKREKLLLAVTMIVLLLLMADKVVLTPALDAWDARNARITELSRSLAKGTALIGQKERYEERWDEFVSQSLPRNASEAENLIFKSVDQWSRKSGLGITSLKPKFIEEKDSSNRLEFVATGEGTIKTVALFIWELEMAPLGVRIEEIEISSRDNAARSLNVTIRFSGLLMASPQETPEEPDIVVNKEVQES